MLKLAQLLFAFLFVISAYCQIPDYFGNNPSWSVREFVGPGHIDEYPSGYDDKVRYYVSGTTTFDDYSYYRIKRKTFRRDLRADAPITFDYYPGSEDYEMFVRQDGRSIYHYVDGIDSLLISYDLEIGDEMSGAYGFLHYDLYHVELIDSVMVGTEYRKRFVFDVLDASYTPVLIEGIGFRNTAEDTYNEGHFFGYPSYFGTFGISFSLELDCYGESGTFLWGDEDACNVSLSIANEQEFGEPELYPNPTNGLISVEHNTIIKEMRIYSIDGQLVETHMINEKSYTADMINLKSGPYMMQLMLEDGGSYRQRIIKN